MYQYTCEICNKVLRSFDSEYVISNPTGHALACEQAQLEHDATDHPETWHREVCPDCGEELGSWPQEYIQNNPTGSDYAISEAHTEHSLICSQSPYSSTPDNWEQWRKDSGARPGETPRQLVRRLVEAGRTFEEILEAIPTPPDRWRVQDGSVVDNWYEEVSYLTE